MYIAVVLVDQSQTVEARVFMKYYNDKNFSISVGYSVSDSVI